MANNESYLALFVFLKSLPGKEWKKFGSKLSG